MTIVKHNRLHSVKLSVCPMLLVNEIYDFNITQHNSYIACSYALHWTDNNILYSVT